MSKKPRSFTIDEDLDAELRERDDVNASGLVNNYLREYLAATEQTEDEILVQQINEEIADIDDEIEDLQDERERLVERRNRIKDRAEEKQQERLTEQLQQYHNIPADPDHPAMKEIAESVGMEAQTVAQKHAAYHDKELQDGKRGFQ